MCTEPCRARRRPAGRDAPRCHLDTEESARRREGTISRRRRVHLRAHLRAQRASCQLWPSPKSRFINDMLMIHAAQILEGLSRHNIKKKKKTKQPSCEREAAEKSYQRSGGKKVHLIISMQERRHHGYAADRRRRSLLYFFPCRRLPLRFLGAPAFYFSLSVTESRPGWLCLPVLVSAAVPG